MAKKVKITSKDFKHNNIEKNVKENRVNNKKKNNIILVVTIISLLANGILGYLTYNYYQKSIELDEVKEELSDTEDELEEVNSSLFSITGLKSVYYINSKLDFMDENIVFKIKGFGSYYYTYDCMMEKISGTGTYSYWAYNKEAAISNGLSKGTC